MTIQKIIFCCVSLLSFALVSCAGSRSAESASGDAACAECGERGEMDLEIFDEKGFVEVNPEFSTLSEVGATVGSFPAQRIVAECPDGNKICHGFSEDAVDFDLAHFEDSLLESRFPKMSREQMLEGLRVPESDSAWIREALQKILDEIFVENRPLADISPWESRVAFPTAHSAFDREIPAPLREKLLSVSKRYNVRYLTLPVFIEVKILPKLGKSGGFAWKSLWTFWDARRGKLLLLSFHEFSAKTKSRVAPERGWAEPFARRLGRELLLDPKTVENH